MSSKGLIIAKKWGWTYRIYKCDALRIAYARINPGGFSSRHRHEHQRNVFILYAGHLLIDLYDDGGQVVYRVDLKPGESVSVQAGLRHRFTALEASELYELYLAEPGYTPEESDIIRDPEETK